MSNMRSSMHCNIKSLVGSLQLPVDKVRTVAILEMKDFVRYLFKYDSLAAL